MKIVENYDKIILSSEQENQEMPNIPKDPAMLLSYINTQLRDYYPSLEECCHSLGIQPEDLTLPLAAIDYHYDRERNQFL